MSETTRRVWLATLGATTPAILGAVLLARALGSGRNIHLPAALILGIACGFVVLAIGRSRGWGAVTGSVLVSMIGVLIGLLFDVKWNSASHIARQMAEERGLEMVQAIIQARAIVGGMSAWELLRARFHLYNLLIPLFAALGAGFTARSYFFARMLRVTDES